MKFRVVCLVFFLSIFLPAQAFAGLSERDVVFLVRSLSFLKSLHHDNVRMVVAYDPADSESVMEAEVFSKSGKDGALSRGRVRLTVELVPVQKIAALKTVDVLVITSGLQRFQSDLARTAERKGAFTISNDLSCVQDGNCVLGVQSQPSVKIVLNSKAASRAGVTFEPAFRMMVTEL